MTVRPNSGIALTIPLTAIVVPEDGLRRVRATAEQDANLLRSIQALGVLQPIIVRAHPVDGALWQIVDGRRRLAGARAAGLETIAAVERTDLTDADATAIEAAANIQRANMAPVDQWRAIRRLQDLGWQLDGAADALGIAHRLARRLDKLSRLHPTALAAIEAHGMPHAHHLAMIARAAPEVQEAAFAKVAEGAEPIWYNVAEACHTRRICRDTAIFDTDLAGVVFEEDLFAEPGAADQFTTTDIEGFMEAQRAALAKRVEDSKGRLQLATLNKSGDAALPKGWQYASGWRFGDARMPKGITGFVWVDTNGDIRSQGAIPPATERPAPTPKAPPTAKAPAADDSTPHEPEADADEDFDDGGGEYVPRPRAEPAPKPRLTEAGRQLLAELRTDALRAALRDRPAPNGTQPQALLLLALSASNLTALGERGSKFGRTSFEDVAAATFAAIFQPDGDRKRDMLDQITREAIARILICNGTKAGNGSGDAAGWIGALVGAEAVLPRLDRADLLASMSGDLLRELAEASGVKPGKVSTMRTALAGNTPNLRLPEAAFGAPIPEVDPEPPPCDRAAGADRCGCGWKAADGDTAEECALATWQAQMRRLGLWHPPAEARQAPAEETPPAPHVCPWDRASPCRDRAEEACQHGCPLRPQFEAWAVEEAARKTRADHEAQRQADAAAFEGAEPAAAPRRGRKPKPQVTCGWEDGRICTQEGTTTCDKLCDRHKAYAAWIKTPIGKAARRKHAGAEASQQRRQGRKVAP
ncbi:ParB/RepB/Spo0J family partition protein [Roseomonas sp. F4]